MNSKCFVKSMHVVYTIVNLIMRIYIYGRYRYRIYYDRISVIWSVALYFVLVLRHGRLTSPPNMGTWEYLSEKCGLMAVCLRRAPSLGQMYLFGEKTSRPSISLIWSVALYFVLVLRHGRLTSPYIQYCIKYNK